MKQKIVGIVLVLCLLFSTFSTPAVALVRPSCSNVGNGIEFVGDDPPLEYSDPNASLSFSLTGLDKNSSFSLHITRGNALSYDDVANVVVDSAVSDGNGNINFSIAAGALFPSIVTSAESNYRLWLTGNSIGERGCDLWGPYRLIEGVTCSSGDIKIRQDRGGNACFFEDGLAGSCLQTPNDKNEAGSIIIWVENVQEGGQPFTGDLQINLAGVEQKPVNVRNGRSQSMTVSLPNGPQRVIIEKPLSLFNLCEKTIRVSSDCQALCLDRDDVDTAENLGPDKFNLCEQIRDPEAKGECEDCAGGEKGTAGIWTAVGCIKREPEEILGRFIRLGIGIGGGVALLMILSAGFQLTISQGNAQKTAQAKEMVTAAITGLLFIIFSVTILQFIGFSILKIPGFGG